jgi:isoleucyl-tRNA synthetase
MLGNLYDYNPTINKIGYNDLFEIDRLILHRLQVLIRRIREAYNKYEYHLIFHILNNFCAVDLSSFYLDILKDRLYVMGPKSKERLSAQTTIHEILIAIVRLMAPILSFTAEEVWGYLPEASVSELSVHLSRFPSGNEDYIDEQLKERWDKIISVRGEVLKSLEIARAEKMIGHSLEARVDIYSPNSIRELLKDYRDQLSTIFIVSETALNDGDINETSRNVFKSNEIEGLKILISHAAGRKCERCWMYSETVGADSGHPTVCNRCVSVLSQLKVGA